MGDREGQEIVSTTMIPEPDVEKLLDAAAKLLHEPPEDDVDAMRLRHLQAENLMLTAKLEMLRRDSRS